MAENGHQHVELDAKVRADLAAYISAEVNKTLIEDGEWSWLIVGHDTADATPQSLGFGRRNGTRRFRGDAGLMEIERDGNDTVEFILDGKKHTFWLYPISGPPSKAMIASARLWQLPSDRLD